MGPDKSLDEIKLIAAALRDVHRLHPTVFNCRALRLTTRVVERRARKEGMGFLTKTLPRLGKAFDKALADDTPLNCYDLGFRSLDNSKLPRFLGEFFSRVLSPNGTLLPDPCIDSVVVLRQIFLVLYKYELPYTSEQESNVIQKFERTENDISTDIPRLESLFSQVLDDVATHPLGSAHSSAPEVKVAREARRLLSELFAWFDPMDITPRHGPGAVSTRERLWNKYRWKNVSAKITARYPLDAYFYASPGHVCDSLIRCSDGSLSLPMTETEFPARFCLVPKDSRGPRGISCEALDYQWIQQGLGRAIVDHVERHPLTRENVRFTDQSPNQFGALLGSRTGGYATLDLNEASDRVSLSLVRLLFPPHICEYLEACRSSSTQLPDGKVLQLNKFAPMGSCLCFPVLALTIWAILTASTHDGDTRKSIYVYGDDVIVPTAFAANAIEQLEFFGLKVNRDKSCTKGFFRESCGTDAFKGKKVTPVRIRTVWSSDPSPDVYTSWIAYANSFYDKRFYSTYEYIVAALHAVYGAIPDDGMHLACPSLRVVDPDKRPRIKRVNKPYQRLEYRVWVTKSPRITFEIEGWNMLLRYFTEFGNSSDHEDEDPWHVFQSNVLDIRPEVRVQWYTRRKTSMLVKRWR